MPDYKQHKIELTPKRQPDGTWQCSYRIIEFRSTCWRFHTGSPDVCFVSRESAVSAALTEAKRIVDVLAPSALPGPIEQLCKHTIRQLTSVLSRSRTLVHASTVMAWSALVRQERNSP